MAPSRRLDGAREASPLDAKWDELCTSLPSLPSSPTPSPPPPRLEQTSASSYRVLAAEGADGAVVVDEDGSVLAFSDGFVSDGVVRTALLHVGEHRPREVRALVHFSDCTAVRSEAVLSWEAELAEFNYEERGGITNNSQFTEDQLRASEPMLQANTSHSSSTLPALHPTPRLILCFTYSISAARTAGEG